MRGNCKINTMKKRVELVRYYADDKTEIAVNLANDTVWLSLNEISELFDRDKSVISRHIRNVYKERELDKDSTVAKFATVQDEGGRQISRDMDYYNLDVIISVGYRVKSQRGTNFRIWATKEIKKNLIERTKRKAIDVRLEEKYIRLISTIHLAANTAGAEDVSAEEAKGILKILQEYAFALETLDKYDRNCLPSPGIKTTDVKIVNYKEATALIKKWKQIEKAGDLFGKEKDDSFKSSLYNVYQTVNGVDVYPGIEEKAANLLYFIVKNHSFVDGNKRIAAGIFAYFLDKNNQLYNGQGFKIIDNNALVAVTIMIAESRSEEKNTIIKLVVSLLTSNN